jgi:WD40 repeat protein
VRLWRVSDGAPLRTLSGHTLNVWSVAWSPDGSQVASGSFDRTVKIWNADDGTLGRTLTGHTQAVVGIAISPDGQLLASGGDDASVKLWRMSDGGLVRTIDVGNHNYKVAFSPDGQFLAGAGRARSALGTVWHDIFGGKLSGENGITVRIWRVSDGALQQALAGHADSAWDLAFSPDGTWLASSSLDKTVILWRLERR